MFYGPIFTEGIDEFLFEQILDPILPGQGLPLPLPVRFGLFAIELQYDASQAIAAGKTTNKFQYTGQASGYDAASTLGYYLMYQPGGMKI
jgi:hypothetical protein